MRAVEVVGILVAVVEHLVVLVVDQQVQHGGNGRAALAHCEKNFNFSRERVTKMHGHLKTLSCFDGLSGILE